jgi:hypothetical protein
MGQITFATTFTGGVGDLVVSCSEISSVLHFTQGSNAPQFMSLPPGNHILDFKGAAPDSPGGSISLSMTGPLASTTTQVFPAGAIPPHSTLILVLS